MSRSLSWIDEDRWSNLLRRSGLGAGPPAASPPALSELRTRPRRREVTFTPSANGSAGPAEAPVFRGTLDERLRELLFWVGRVTGSDVLFVADEHGLPLQTLGQTSDLVAASAPLMDSFEKIRDVLHRSELGFCSLLLERRRLLSVAEAQTEWGRFALGFVSADTLDMDTLQHIHNEFENAFMQKGVSDG